MSADREELGTTERDIGLLLADTAQGFDLGPAPVQAVVRAGRARRARRRAALGVAAAAVVCTVAGTLVATGLPGGPRSAEPARQSSVGSYEVDEPQIVEVGFGVHDGKGWAVKLQVWSPPRDRAEAARQSKAMDEWGIVPSTTGGLNDLIGRTSYFVIRAYAQNPAQLVTFGTAATLPGEKGKDIQVFAQPLNGTKGPLQLAVGKVAKTVKQVACHWKDGSTTLADLAPVNSALRDDNAVIRPVAAYPTANWFVCVAPGSTEYRSAEVTK